MASANIMERCPCAGSAIAADRAEEAAEAAKQTAKGVNEARDIAAEALRYAREAEAIRDMTTGAHALDTGEPPTAAYDRQSNHMEFGLPKGKTGNQGVPGDPPAMMGEAETEGGLPATALPGQVWFTSSGDLYYCNPGTTTLARITNLRGPVGPAMSIKGVLSSEDELPSAGEAGDIWFIGSHLWGWDPISETWIDQGELQIQMDSGAGAFSPSMLYYANLY